MVEALSGPDGELGKLLLGLWIREEANHLGIPTDAIPDEFGEKVVERILTLEAKSAEVAAAQIALHKAAGGDFETAGRLIREHVSNGAVAIKFIPNGIKRSQQAKEYGSLGAARSRKIGRNNRQKVEAAINEILASRQRKPSDRQLADLVNKKTGIPVGTVRGHINKINKQRKEKNNGLEASVSSKLAH